MLHVDVCTPIVSMKLCMFMCTQVATYIHMYTHKAPTYLHKSLNGEIKRIIGSTLFTVAMDTGEGREELKLEVLICVYAIHVIWCL